MANADDETLKLFFAEMRDWRATIATKDDLAVLRDAMNVRFTSLDGEVAKLAALIVENHVDRIGEDEQDDAVRIAIDDLRARVERLEQRAQ